MPVKSPTNALRDASRTCTRQLAPNTRTCPCPRAPTPPPPPPPRAPPTARRAKGMEKKKEKTEKTWEKKERKSKRMLAPFRRVWYKKTSGLV